MPGAEKKPAVFLDRDGTINVDKHYLHKGEDFEFILGVPQAIKKLKKAGYLVIVVTNQSGVARGYFSLDDVTRLHEHMQKQLAAAGTGIDAFYVCPHHPAKGQGEYLKKCDCRKGRPGLLLQASADLGIDLQKSYMIGDKLADIEAGENAGCQPILVLTGYGQETRHQVNVTRTIVCENLGAAVDTILENKKFK
ncbi:MAG: D-glycero-beta-D-manno-heptose 1,7-bisphosphate 7-phosphatase [Desulfuromonadales bacterium]